MRTRFISLCLLSLLGQPALAADWLYLTETGDTLSQIGQTYLKNPRDWPKIQSVNGVPIPEKLPANTRIKIPVALLKVTPAPVTVTAVTGNARVKPGDGPFRPLAVGDQLSGGESVLTGPRSSVAYRFADGTVLTQQDSSKLGFGRLKSYGKTGMVSTELSLTGGRLEASASKQLAPLGGFQVKTPVAVAGLRGTGFRLNVSEDGKSLRNEVLEGVVAVAGQGKEVRVAAGQGTYAELGKPPAPPRPLLAAPESADLPPRVRTLPLEFSWAPVPGAQGYRAQLARDAAFAQVVLDDRIAEPHLKWIDDLPDGQYVLRLRAVDGDGLEGFNRDLAFELDARPFPPLLSAPALGERLYQNDAVLTWSAASGAQGYLVQISPTPDFSREVVEQRLPAVLRLQATLPEGEWHWRAASLDEAGQPHLWSAHRAFRVQPLPGAPGGGQAKAGEGKAEFAWHEAKGAARYGFQVAGGQDMDQPLMSRETEKTAASAELKPGKYFWRARGVEADGQSGAWSEASPVIMPPPRPTDLTARVEGGQIQANWKGEAPVYRLELARDQTFTQPVAKATVQETKGNLAKPEPGTYWLRAVALGADGVESPASAPLTMEVKQEVPWWLLILLVPFL